MQNAAKRKMEECILRVRVDEAVKVLERVGGLKVRLVRRWEGWSMAGMRRHGFR